MTEIELVIDNIMDLTPSISSSYFCLVAVAILESRFAIGQLEIKGTGTGTFVRVRESELGGGEVFCHYYDPFVESLSKVSVAFDLWKRWHLTAAAKMWSNAFASPCFR